MVQGKIIYFDNAATSYPKPEAVYQTQDASLRKAGNPGRGAHRLAVDSARTVFESRTAIAAFLGIASPERLIFTPGCTYSINTILRGLSLGPQNGSKDAPRGQTPVVIVSPLEHNAVMRPLDYLEKAGLITIHRMRYSPGGVIDMQEFGKAVKELKPVLCTVQEGSNVTGELVDIVSAWEICQEAKTNLLIDAAQTAGTVTSHLGELTAAGKGTAYGGSGLFWCSSGHKGLLGPAGIGLLFVPESMDVEPLIAGGTGSNSENLEMPAEYPDRLESGTQPVHLIAALAQGISWLRDQGPKTLEEKEGQLTRRFLSWCSNQPHIKVFGKRTLEPKGSRREEEIQSGLPIVAFAVEGVSSDSVADQLDRDFGIAVRSGLHCAMAAHQSLGTLKTGLVRASFGCFNTSDEIDELCRALGVIYQRSKP